MFLNHLSRPISADQGQTYGIPTISQLLVKTGELCADDTASKRAADTGVLILEVLENHPTDKRGMEAMARMNYLHNRYRKAGKISNDDMLYTLSLFLHEPLRWIKRYEWRDASEIERCALGLYWRWYGESAEISYEALTFPEKQCKSGLEFADALDIWSREYEEKYMVPAETNKQMAKGTGDIKVNNWPDSLKPFGRKLTVAFMEPRLRKAMMAGEVSAPVEAFLNSVMVVRAFVTRNIALPRPSFLAARAVSEKPDKNGRLYKLDWIDKPWYVKPTFGERYGVPALLMKAFGRPVAGSEGTRFHPEGYVVTDIGPESLKGKGLGEMEKEKEKLRGRKNVGCPFMHA